MEIKAKIRIGNAVIGEGKPVFIIAEAGINHNGSLKLAKKLINAAKNAGADAVKFQTHLPEKEMLPKTPTANYVGEPLFALLKRMEFSKKDHQKLKEYAVKNNIIFLSTPFSKEAADLLDDIKVPAFKIGSGELTNLPFLAYVAKKGKPVILSTGMSEWDEIEEAVATVKKFNQQLIILQCTSSYPADYKDINLGVMKKLKERFNFPVGLSDHSVGIYPALAAVALGACIIEKHFTVSRTWPGPDQKVSIEPRELADLVKGVRVIEMVLGSSKKVLKVEKGIQRMARESVVSIREIPKGSIITVDMVWVKRPGIGIPAKELNKVIGCRAKKRIPVDRLIRWEELIR